jgi:hypothetical protein
MSALVKCPACGGDVAKDADACPKCGKRLAQSWGRVIALLIVGAIVVVFAARWMGLF